MAISDLLHDTILAAKLPVQYKVVCGEHTGIDNESAPFRNQVPKVLPRPGNLWVTCAPYRFVFDGSG
jgi:hypothetical protein